MSAVKFELLRDHRGTDYGFIVGKSPGRKAELVLSRMDIEPEYRSAAWPKIVAALTGDEGLVS